MATFCSTRNYCIKFTTLKPTNTTEAFFECQGEFRAYES